MLDKKGLPEKGACDLCKSQEEWHSRQKEWLVLRQWAGTQHSKRSKYE